MYDFSWRFLQDWHNEFEDQLTEKGVVAIQLYNGWLIACTGEGKILRWTDLDDVTPEEIFDGD